MELDGCELRRPRRVEALLDVIEHHILPLTEAYVRQGHDLFGGGILDVQTLRPVVVGSNREGENPIFHGEIDTILRFYELPQRPAPRETLFLSTHEPCPMCLSALAWCGFREVWYLFSYAETAQDFGVPDDRNILEELFGARATNPRNRFLELHPIREAASAAPEAARLLSRMDRLKELYRALPLSPVLRGRKPSASGRSLSPD